MRYKNLNVRVRGKQVIVFNFRLYLYTYDLHVSLISTVGRAVIQSLADYLAWPRPFFTVTMGMHQG